MVRRFVGFVFLAISSIFALNAQVELPEDFIDELLPVNIERPIGIQFSDDGFGFIHQKEGRIFCLDTLGALYAEPVIDISEEVAAFGDHGLVGVALHPEFVTNGFIYLFYVVDRHYLKYFGTDQYDPETTIENQATIGRITRYQLNVNTGYKEVVPDSRKIILGHDFSDGIPILMISHGVGSLAFGQDGTLLASIGDSGSFTEKDKGNAVDTYHEQSMLDGSMTEHQNVGSFRSMMINSLNGRVLRLNPENGQGVSSNPFFDPQDPTSDASRTWVLGFRNPYKFIHVKNTGSHDPAQANPGLFILGDVGASSWEEINYIEQGGAWYGWPMYEGYYGNWQFQGFEVENRDAENPLFGKDGCEQEFFLFQDLYANEFQFGEPDIYNPCSSTVTLSEDTPYLIHKRPKLAYNNNLWNPPTRTEVGGFDDDGKPISMSVLDTQSGMGESSLQEGGSSIPGDINSYSNFPDQYSNHLFQVDYHGFISSVELDESFEPVRINKFVDLPKGITDCAFSPKDGRLYYVNFLESQIRRIEYGGILPPTIHLDVDQHYGPSPLEVKFDASNSVSNSGTELSYAWNFGDNETAEGSIVQRSFNGAGVKSFEVELVVTDSLGLSSTTHQIISVNNTPPSPTITSIKDGSTYSMDDYSVVLLQAEVEDSEHENDELDYTWRVDFYHDEHFHPGPAIHKEESYAIFDPLGCEDELYWYKIFVEVEDAGGLKGTDTVEVYPYCGPAFIEIINLQGNASDGVVELSWQTSFEDSVDHFIIERTPDYLFQNIGFVSSGLDPYQFTDTAPFNGVNYYRIRAIHQEGHYSFSNIIKVETNEDKLFDVFPNPSSGIINIERFIDFESVLFLDIFSVNGSLMEGMEILASDFQEQQKLIDLSHLSPGVYFVRLSDGIKSETRKLVLF